MEAIGHGLYAAAAMLWQMLWALVPSLAYIFASTNLVIELGIVLWMLMGWRFVLAEVLGAL